ncbi:MAG: aminotransferase class III-fold pyridoxal phosphate-dependent enzyme [Actinomycetales bacterium]|nr:aminotransferase class III-fold pyridoxal phosphate-dependent enzyme [Actinomycetales bacterium]
MSSGSASAFWHPFADMSVVAGHDLVIASGSGARVTDEEGREYLDATAALWYCNVGHGRAEIGDAVRRQMGEIAAYSNFGDLATRPTLELADRLAAMAPMPDAKVFFTSGGSDAVDTAVKLVRRYWDLVGQPERTVIITRERSYHGMHMAGTALAGIPANRAGYGPLDSGVVNVPWDDPAALAEAIDRIGADRVAAFFCEPVIGAGGVYPPPAGYLDAVREVCRERGVLFVADEVITGYGRTGRMFASEGLEPDLVLTAKGLTSGYLPMGAVLVAGSVARPFWESPGALWRHGYTYSGHASAAAAAMANLDIIEREGLVAQVRALELSLTAALVPLRQHTWVSETRSGVGLLGAVTLEPAVLSADATAMPRLIAALRDRGVLTRALADGSVQVSPPFVITRDELQALGAAIDGALTDVGSTRNVTTSSAGDPLLPEVTSDEAGGFGSSDDRLLADVPPHHGA